MALAIAKDQPSSAAVISNVGGSNRGDADQKAMTPEIRVPSDNNAAINGMTSQEQKGANPPIRAAMNIILISRL
mgnify:CR=1 FL=1